MQAKTQFDAAKALAKTQVDQCTAAAAKAAAGAAPTENIQECRKLNDVTEYSTKQMELKKKGCEKHSCRWIGVLPLYCVGN